MPKDLTEKQAFDACTLVCNLAKSLERGGFSIEKPWVPGIFRYGVCAPDDKAYWLQSTWKDYFAEKDNPLYLFKQSHLGDFVIEFEPEEGIPVVRWRLLSPIDEAGTINTSHCETLRELALALNTTIHRLLSDEVFTYNPYPF